MKKAMLLIVLLCAPVLAQNSMKDALVKHWKTSGEFTIAVAETMPAENYSFRPNPEEMSFGQLIAHIAGANNYACANASGLPRPAAPAKIEEWNKNPNKVDIDKETAITFMKDSFEYCNKAVAAMTPEKFDTVAGPQQRNLTGF